MRKRIFGIIQIGNETDIPSRAFDYGIVICIFANIAVLFLNTFEELAAYHTLFQVVEYTTAAIFLIEYLLRIWTAKYLYPEEKSSVKAALMFVFSFYGIIDLLTILPVFFLSGFVFLRMFRVARIFHLFKINSKYDSFNVIARVFKECKNQLLSSLFIILMMMMCSSLSMYAVEHDVQPEAFKNALSGIWWSLSAILTVGYGDVYPITPLGQFLAMIIEILGVAVVAIPTGIISAGFVKEYTAVEKNEEKQKDSE